MLMEFARKLALGILSPLFIILLFATAFDIGFVRTASHPVTVKRLVAESGIYNSVVPNVLAQTKSITTSLGDVPTSDPAVQNAARVALPPQYIQQNTEMAIDNIYQWLDGKIAQPSFKIDLAGAKTLFANNIADSLQKRMAGLPACSAAQTRQIVQTGFDAYQAPCLPRGTNPSVIAQQVKAGIINQQDFLKNLDLSAASIKSGNTGQSVFEQKGVKNLPTQYQRAKKTPWILSILTILSGAAIVFLSRSWQTGLRHIAINLLVIGLVMLLFSWVLNRTVSTNIVPKIKVDSAIFQQDIRRLVTDLAHQVDRNYWFFGGLYSALGLAGIITAQLAIRRQGPGTPSSTEAGYREPPRRPGASSSGLLKSKAGSATQRNHPSRQ
jgi:hypothetical protein